MPTQNSNTIYVATMIQTTACSQDGDKFKTRKQCHKTKSNNVSKSFWMWHHSHQPTEEQGGSRIGTISAPKRRGQSLGYPLYFMILENGTSPCCPAASRWPAPQTYITTCTACRCKVDSDLGNNKKRRPIYVTIRSCSAALHGPVPQAIKHDLLCRYSMNGKQKRFEHTFFF